MGLLTTSQHVPVAVSRHPENAMPISGSFTGPTSAFLNAEVNVRVENIGISQGQRGPVIQQTQLVQKIA
jgi:hypothetical protein